MGDQIRVKEGVAASVLQELRDQLNLHGGTWDVVVPVIAAGSHTGWKEVLGFTAIRLTLVVATGGDKRIEGITLGDYVAPNTFPGGSTNYGLYSGSPRLLK